MTAAGFAVLMPVYWRDKADQVEAAFRSVTDGQELPPAQIVVVRDGPVGPALTDVLVAVARRPDVTLVTLPANRGLAQALNAGLAECHFDVVARQDADDISTPDRFRRQAPLVESGQFDLLGSAMREFSAGPASSADSAPAGAGDRAADAAHSVRFGRIRSYPLTAEEIWRTAKLMNPLAHPTVVTRRSLVEAVGGYRDLFHLEDYDLWVRLGQAGAKAGNLPEPLVDYRISPGSSRRRGGCGTLRAEIALQSEFHASGFITRAEQLRNLALRGGLELAPPALLARVLDRTWRQRP
ncbi:MAG: glycosyltransferase [Bifidobacteriaceae bacterium]|jgi:glycosyltransferase involved in cell wall biosynthesis|nr:glycosyltransferase [Bifidobacteriaceae bacterium]